MRWQGRHWCSPDRMIEAPAPTGRRSVFRSHRRDQFRRRSPCRLRSLPRWCTHRGRGCKLVDSSADPRDRVCRAHIRCLRRLPGLCCQDLRARFSDRAQARSVVDRNRRGLRISGAETGRRPPSPTSCQSAAPSFCYGYCQLKLPLPERVLISQITSAVAVVQIPKTP